MMRNTKLIAVLIACAAFGAACTERQQDSALTAMRSMQASGVAQAAELPAPPPADPVSDSLQQAPAQDPGPPGLGGPPPGGAAAPAGGTPADPAAGQPDTPKTPEQIIEDFIASDPREILETKEKDLKDRQTKPWDMDRPETFIPETGRKDPMTLVLSEIPEELRPPRTGDDDESELQTFLFTAFATQALQQVTLNLRCHSVIQIGVQKYAQMSFRGQSGRFTISEGQGFSTGAPGPVPLAVGIEVISISTTEVVVLASVEPRGTTVRVEKTLVFIPRN